MYAGGGGGYASGGPGTGGTGGGGTGTDGAVNTGGGGGNKALNPNFSQGGSGIVVVRYVIGQSGFTVAGGLTETYTIGSTDYQSHTFLATEVLTITGTGNVDALIISGGGSIGVNGSNEGYSGGGGGAGGMLVINNTSLVTGSYVVVVGAGGGYSQGGGIQGFEGSMGRDGGTGNLSYITPRRILTFENPTGDFVVGEALDGGTSGATGDVLAI